jgi:hypothetical protein
MLSLGVCLAFYAVNCGGRETSADEIEQVARWIRASSVQTKVGTTWPGVPGDTKTINNTLYSGTPGVVKFFLEAFLATGAQDFLEDARTGANYFFEEMKKNDRNNYRILYLYRL